jgi:MFS family permease
VKVTKKEAYIISKAIQDWENDRLLNPEEAKKLQESMEVRTFDWQGLAFYSFLFAIIFFVVAFVSLLADNLILKLIDKIAETKDIIKSAFFASISFLFFYFALKRRKNSPQKLISNEALFFLGTASSATAFTYLGLALNYSFGHYSFMILGASVIYAILGYIFPSKFIWVFSLISLGIWFGFQTALIAGWEPYFWGMNYPMRFTIFGACLTVLSFVTLETKGLYRFHKATFTTSLLYLFIPLWLLSIFGNHGDIEVWIKINQIEMWYWSLILLGFSVGAIYYGQKYHNIISRDIGWVFLLLNVYTRFFEYGWINLNKAVFFALLAGSFWFIGRKAEKLVAKQ